MSSSGRALQSSRFALETLLLATLDVDRYPFPGPVERLPSSAAIWRL